MPSFMQLSVALPSTVQICSETSSILLTLVTTHYIDIQLTTYTIQPITYTVSTNKSSCFCT